MMSPRRRSAGVGAVVLTVVVAAVALAQRPVAPPIRVIRPEPEPVERLTPIVIDNVRYISTNDLARIFSATKY